MSYNVYFTTYKTYYNITNRGETQNTYYDIIQNAVVKMYCREFVESFLIYVESFKGTFIF